MKKVSIIYWSNGGNVELIANAISEGAISDEVEVDTKHVADASIEEVLEADAVAFGSKRSLQHTDPTAVLSNPQRKTAAVLHSLFQDTTADIFFFRKANQDPFILFQEFCHMLCYIGCRAFHRFFLLCQSRNFHDYILFHKSSLPFRKYIAIIHNFSHEMQ